jgi:beta-lactamase regulating signal transducer with metallopeptidase domain
MIAYIVKSSLSLIILFGLYWFLLRKEKLFVFNRYFLVLSVVFSLLVPFISIPVNFQTTFILENFIPAYDNVIPEISTPDNIVPGDVNISQPNVEKQISVINISAFLLALYISGVILFLIRFLRNIYIIMLRTKSSEKISFKWYRLVLTNDKTDPCCFFSSIYLNRDDYLNGRIDKELLDHELEHAKQSHTIDIILIELVKIFYWFNPVHILYDRAIRINHEYLADDAVVSEKSDIKSYAEVLLSFIRGSRNMSLTSGSNHSFTKMRLMMMMKPGSGSFIYRARITMTLFMGTALLLLLSFTESDKQPSPLNLSETGTEIAQNIVRGIVLTENGKPLGGATITGTGIDNTSLETIADFDGRFTLNDIKHEASLLIAYRGFKSQTLKADFASEMVVRLVRDPDFNGRVFITEVQKVNFRNSDFSPAKALLVINGEIIDNNGNLRVNPGEIKSFKILKDKEATNKYGDKAKDGAVEIILYGNRTGSANKKLSDNPVSDSSKYKTLLGVNHKSNKGELIDIPVSNLQYVSVWTDNDIDNTDIKGLRSTSIFTRDYFKVKGRVVRENGKPLPGVKISVADNPVTEISDKEGRFEIEDVREGALLEFSLPGYKTYYLSTLYEVAFNMEMTIELTKDNIREKDDIYVKAEGTRYPEDTKAYNMADFSGKWVFNRSQSKSFLAKVASSTLIISQDKNSITMDITITPDKIKPVNRTEKYVYNTSIANKNNQGDKLTVITCTPSPDGQSFSITETLSYAQNGIEKVTKRVSVYSLGKDGKTLIINQDDTLPEGSLTPEDERHETRVYDKSI